MLRHLTRQKIQLHSLHFSKLSGLPLLIICASLFAVAGTCAAAVSANPALRTVIVQKIAEITGNMPSQTTVRQAELTQPQSNTTTQQTDQSSHTDNSLNVTKYSTSADPRSTDYSLTPHVNQASFEHRVTYAGQYTAGTLLAYNASKGDRTYYGGDLIITPSTVTIHIIDGYAYTSQPLTITAPDGAAIGMPTIPWYITDNVAFVAYDSDTEGTVPQLATSWPMGVVLMQNSHIPGTYLLHISSGHAEQGPDAWEYDGFITINVVVD